MNGPECRRDVQIARDAYESMAFGSLPVFGSQLPDCETLPYSQNNKETCTSGYIDVTLLVQNQTDQNQTDQNQTPSANKQWCKANWFCFEIND